jgi:hypothetical protein
MNRWDHCPAVFGTFDPPVRVKGCDNMPQDAETRTMQGAIVKRITPKKVLSIFCCSAMLSAAVMPSFAQVAAIRLPGGNLGAPGAAGGGGGGGGGAAGAAGV